MCIRDSVSAHIDLRNLKALVLQHADDRDYVWVNPVSYTHLDVYKRQVVFRVNFRKAVCQPLLNFT